MGLELEELTAAGKFFQLWQPPYELTLDRLANRLLDDVKLRNVKRVAIDGLDGFRLASVDPDRTIRFVTALSNDLRARGVTVLITEETHAPYGPNIATRVEGVSALADNIILLEYMTTGTDLRRLLSVVKQRRSAGRGHVRELTLGDRGLEVAANADSVADLLAQRGLLGGSGIRRSQVPQVD
jgi:circadian clock protein KaiC